MEVIEVMSDDEKTNKKKSKSCNSDCINFKCKSGVNLKPASSFACAYYGITKEKKQKKRRVICQECFYLALQHQQVTYSLKMWKRLNNILKDCRLH